MTDLRPWLLGIFVAASLVVACGGDDDGGGNGDDLSPTSVSGEPTAAGGEAVEPAPDMTSDEVCALVSAEEASEALGVEVTQAGPGLGSTPSCSYAFQDGSTTTNTVLAVMRASDVSGLAGAEAFDFALQVNRQFSAGAPETEVDGLGDQAVFLEGSALSLLIVQAGPRVITVAGTPLTMDGAVALAAVAVGKL